MIKTEMRSEGYEGLNVLRYDSYLCTFGMLSTSRIMDPLNFFFFQKTDYLFFLTIFFCHFFVIYWHF